MPRLTQFQESSAESELDEFIGDFELDAIARRGQCVNAHGTIASHPIRGFIGPPQGHTHTTKIHRVRSSTALGGARPSHDGQDKYASLTPGTSRKLGKLHKHRSSHQLGHSELKRQPSSIGATHQKADMHQRKVPVSLNSLNSRMPSFTGTELDDFKDLAVDPDSERTHMKEPVQATRNRASLGRRRSTKANTKEKNVENYLKRFADSSEDDATLLDTDGSSLSTSMTSISSMSSSSSSHLSEKFPDDDNLDDVGTIRASDLKRYPASLKQSQETPKVNPRRVSSKSTPRQRKSSGPRHHTGTLSRRGSLYMGNIQSYDDVFDSEESVTHPPVQTLSKTTEAQQCNGMQFDAVRGAWFSLEDNEAELDLSFDASSESADTLSEGELDAWELGEKQRLRDRDRKSGQRHDQEWLILREESYAAEQRHREEMENWVPRDRSMPPRMDMSHLWDLRRLVSDN